MTAPNTASRSALLTIVIERAKIGVSLPNKLLRFRDLEANRFNRELAYAKAAN